MNESNRSEPAAEKAMKRLRGLCFSFHHQNRSAVGSRRFRNLSEELKQHNIELDIICGRIGKRSSEIEPGITTAGDFAPFQALMKVLLKIKKSVSSSAPQTDTRQTLGNANAETFSDETATADSSLTSLLLSFENLPDSDAGWVLPAAWAGIRIKKKYDFIISTAPPWSSHIAAILAGRWLGLPVILDDRDPWAGSQGRLLYMTHPMMRRYDRRLASLCYSKTAGIVCVTDSACQMHLKRDYGQKIRVNCLPNGFNANLAQQATARNRQDKINISYVGSYYHGRSPMIVLKAALALPDEISKDFHFHFVGNISADETRQIDSLEKHFEVTIYGPKSHQFCLERISDSDICLLLAIGQPDQIPAKLYEYIGLKRPVLTFSENNDATMRQIEDNNWGWATHDSNSITKALSEIYDQWQNDKLRQIDLASAQAFGFDTIAKNYAQFIKSVIS